MLYTMTKEEFLQYKEEQRKQAAYARIRKLAGLGQCKGLTEDEWFEIHEKGKSRYKQKIQY